MKINKKGFAISTMLYGIIFVAIAVFYMIINYVSNRNTDNVTFVEGVRDSLPKVEEIQPTSTLISDKIKDNINNSTCNPSIVDIDGVTYLSGDDACINFNYVWYSGKLWRIISINPDDSMKMITQNVMTSISFNPAGSSTNPITFTSESWLYQWLNEDFKDTLYNYQNIIDENTKWDATLDTKATPVLPIETSIVEGAVGTLNVYEYYQSYKNASKVANGYLNIKQNWWSITPYNNTIIRYIKNDGTINRNTAHPKATGVRPVVKLKSKITFKSGDGSIEKPFIIEGDKEIGKANEKINTRLSGEYVKLNDQLYRIIGLDDNGNSAKLISFDYIKNGTAILKKNYSLNINYGNGTKAAHWDYYLNETWVTDIKQYLIEGTYYIGTVGDEANYKNAICEEANTSKTVNDCEKVTNIWTGYVGLPRVGEMFSTQLVNGSTLTPIWLITLNNASKANIINATSNKTSNTPTGTTAAVRATINLKPEIIITSGEGTKDKPYEIALPS